MLVENLMPPIPEPSDTAFNEVVEWLLDNHGLLVLGEKHGAGLIVPLRTRIATATAINAFKTLLIPYQITEKMGPSICRSVLG